MKKFSINNVKFDDNDFEYIKNKIINEYKELYLDCKIKIQYKTVKGNWTFRVFTEQIVIIDVDKTDVVMVLTCEYNNSQAINIFILDDDLKRFYSNKYYYSQLGCIDELKAYIDKTCTLQALCNIEMEWKIDDDHIVIFGPDTTGKSFFTNRNLLLLSFTFSDNIITKEQLISFTRRINSFIKKISK